MKAKTIKAVLRKKIDDWLSSIEDESLRKLAAQNTIVTGGAIASMLLGEKVSDYDVYFTDEETTFKVAEYYVDKFKENPPPKFKESKETVNISVKRENGRVAIVVKSAGIAGEQGDDASYQYFEQYAPEEGHAHEYVEEVAKSLEEKDEDGKDKPRYRPVFITSNAITLSHDIQIVIRFYGEPDEIHKNYDFIHCTNWWTANDGQLELKKEALESLLSRELRYQGSRYPICSVIRTRKFLNRGWHINAGQYLKMCMQISELDLSNINVLEDQLVGVDAAYFQQIIRLLKEKGMDKVDHAYLVEIIDRIF